MSYRSKSCSHCVESTKNPLIPLEQNGKKFLVKNSSRNTVHKVQVDGCAITAGKKCDWLVVDHRDIEYFVELKGASVLEGCQQLEVSIPQLSVDPKQGEKHAFVICARVSPKITTQLQLLKLKFKKQFNSTLTIKQCQHSIQV